MANLVENSGMASGLGITGTHAVDRVAIPVPEFYSSDPELWFSIIEYSFKGFGITIDSSKFNFVLSVLHPRYAAEVRDIIMNPPAEGAYQKLKLELVRRYQQKNQHLLEHEEMGDRKPSQFLRYLQGLAGSSSSAAVLRILWMKRLPENMQVILAAHKDAELKELAEIADAIYETTDFRSEAETSMPRVSVAGASGSSRDIETWLISKMARLTMTLQREIATIKREIHYGHRPSRYDQDYPPRSPVGTSPRCRQRSQSRRQLERRQRSRSRRRLEKRQGKCFYHWRFGANAYRCEKPCTWKEP